MNLQFRYRSVWADFLMYFTILSTLILPFVINGAVKNSDKDASLILSAIVFLLYPTVMLCIAFCLTELTARLKADESSVEFIFLLRRVNIKYSDIKSIEVKNEYVEGSFRGEKPRYEEVITIVCKNTEYCFDNIMEFEVGRFEANPEDLAMQFKCGVFRRLKEYISKQTGIEF